MASNELKFVLEEEIKSLKQKLNEKELELKELNLKEINDGLYCTALTSNEISRYSRQMIMPEVGLSGQIKLKNSKVLIVGTGGLGCPAALYLAAAGVGEITLVDGDEVELTNLHRQILHTEASLDLPKVKSGYTTLTNLNSNITIIPKHMHADSTNLQQLVQENNYDVVIDGSDNVPTRYLLNDICVINDLPLVSGSALQMEGQLTVYHCKDGPCYRCLFPIPPPPETVTSCGDGGVLGVVPGTIGILQALETIKIILDLPGILYGRLLVFDGSDTTFRNIRLRKKNLSCEVCGENPSVTKPIDYVQFCGAKAHDKVENIKILQKDEEIEITDFSKILNDQTFLIDVRPEIEFEMCHLPNSLNIPYTSLKKNKDLTVLQEQINERCTSEASNVFVICRRGNDSQRAISLLKENFSHLPVSFINVNGGLLAYSKNIDSCFPIY